MNVEHTARERLRAIFLGSAFHALQQQSPEGAMPAGHNGPYRHPETPVRNTAHWAITFARAWELSGDPRCRTAADRALDYLLDCFEHAGRSVVPCRVHRRKDASNGVMGQAWLIEGLVEAGRRIGRDEALTAAAALFRAHPYRFHEGAWQKLGPGGRPNGFDWTFNHQLWFCAAGALLVRAGVDESVEAVSDFAGRLGHRLRLYPDGVIKHANNSFLRGGVKLRTQGIARTLYYWRHAHAMRGKSLGYHCFNTYALALIEDALPNLRALESVPVRKALDCVCTNGFREGVGTSAFGFPYNPPGLEAAFTIDVAFPDRGDDSEWWIQRQLEETSCPSEGALVRHAVDLATARARIYEAARLL